MSRSNVIGIDASRLSVDRLTGTENYTFELIKALAALNSDQAFRLYFNANEPPDRLPGFGEAICIPFPRLWTHARLSYEMFRHRPGLLFVPAHVIPLVHPRSVVTIHDLGYLHHPESHTESDRRMLDWTTRWSARQARRIIAISRATKSDLVTEYRIDPEKIDVVPHGVSSDLRPAEAGEIQRVRQELKLPERYILGVGTVQPRKNLARLAEAVTLLRAQGLDYTLLIAGKRGWLADQIDREMQASGSVGAVRFLGYVEDRDLAALYSGATIFCQPSLYEGFGMPMLEAMACGVPAAAANRSSLPEVGGEAALYFDPFDPGDIAATLARILGDASLRGEMVARGRDRAATFTWQRTAGATLAVLQRVLH